MDIILWRHADAEYGPPDLQRRLTDKGHRQAEAAAKWLNRHLPADYQVWASEAARSQQTAAYLGRELARAEASLRTGEPFVQDAAPDAAATDSGGDMAGASAASCCAPGTACDTPSLQAKACC